MKKLLSILTAVAVVASTSTSAISCSRVTVDKYKMKKIDVESLKSMMVGIVQKDPEDLIKLLETTNYHINGISSILVKDIKDDPTREGTEIVPADGYYEVNVIGLVGYKNAKFNLGKNDILANIITPDDLKLAIDNELKAKKYVFENDARVSILKGIDTFESMFTQESKDKIKVLFSKEQTNGNIEWIKIKTVGNKTTYSIDFDSKEVKDVIKLNDESRWAADAPNKIVEGSIDLTPNDRYTTALMLNSFIDFFDAEQYNKTFGDNKIVIKIYGYGPSANWGTIMFPGDSVANGVDSTWSLSEMTLKMYELLSVKFKLDKLSRDLTFLFLLRYVTSMLKGSHQGVRGNIINFKDYSGKEISAMLQDQMNIPSKKDVKYYNDDYGKILKDFDFSSSDLDNKNITFKDATGKKYIYSWSVINTEEFDQKLLHTGEVN